MKLEFNAEIDEIKIDGNQYPMFSKITLGTDNLNERKTEKLMDIYNNLNNTNNTNIKKLKITFEIQDPILDEAERKYLSGVIRPFRDRVDYIEKIDYPGGERIIMKMKNTFEYLNLPFFKKGSMYKKIELDKKYTLKDLGL